MCEYVRRTLLDPSSRRASVPRQATGKSRNYCCCYCCSIVELRGRDSDGCDNVEHMLISLTECTHKARPTRSSPVGSRKRSLQTFHAYAPIAKRLLFELEVCCESRELDSHNNNSNNKYTLHVGLSLVFLQKALGAKPGK